MAAEKVKGIRVIAKRENFRRAGRVFGGEPADIRLSDLKLDRKSGVNEERAIREDPMLVVVDIELPAPADAAPVK